MDDSGRDTNQPAERRRRRIARPRRQSVRDQKVSIEHATPGGALGVPDERERRQDPAAPSERGDALDDPSSP